MTPNILKSSLQSASFNIPFQIICRCVTFLLNAFVIRHVGQAVLGVMNVRLLLLESMILFLSREPFMRACMTNTRSHNWAQVVNMLWVTVPICLVLSYVFSYIWLNYLPTNEQLPPYYSFAVWSVAISCVINLATLVAELVVAAFLFVRLKIVFDSTMIAIRTLTFVSIILYRSEDALYAFGVAQLVAAIFYAAAHYGYFHYYTKRIQLCKKLSGTKFDDIDEYTLKEFPFASIKDFLPGQLENKSSYFDWKLTVLIWSFFKQGILKQILTEGERLIMTVMPVLSFAEQGTYEVVNNLGSLAARFIFRPIEDNFYFYFTQMVKRDEKISNQSPDTVQESVKVLSNLCSTIVSLGLVILVFGQSYSSLLLFMYGGEKFTSDLPVLLMRSHCLAVLLLGVNGVTEGYMNATADSSTINKNNYVMIYESVAFLGASYLFTIWLGPVGFIYGNCVNMALRIVHSTLFISKRHQDTEYKPLQGIFPKPIFSGSLLISIVVTILSERMFYSEQKLIHLLIGAVMFFMVLICWTYEYNEISKLVIERFKVWWDKKVRRKKSQ